MSKYVDELMGDSDLEDMLDDQELGNIFKKIGKGLGKVAKGVVKVATPIAASFVPGGSAALSIGKSVAGAVGKAAKGGKKKSTGKKLDIKGIVKKAKSTGKQIGEAQKSAKAVERTPQSSDAEVRRMALAAPVPMPVAANTIVPALDLQVKPLTIKQLDAAYGPRFKQIEDQLKLFSLQNQATSEHKRIKADEQYKRNLLSKLNKFAAARPR